jgi:homoserine acetyltransferase
MEKSEADLSGVRHRQIVMHDPKTREGSYLDADENDDGDLCAQ